MQMTMKMTIRKALLIQRAQMTYYRRSIGRSRIKAIRQRTNIPVDANIDTPINISEINGYIPRGGSFEGYIRNIPETPDPTEVALHDAILKGLA